MTQHTWLLSTNLDNFLNLPSLVQACTVAPTGIKLEGSYPPRIYFDPLPRSEKKL